ncbi:hypothetical protein ABW21_db0206440 [Orbilia brochopaga]|nr:hypothetical protein ABW21_db0206440 [Drechslerella brochopaga]
MDDYKPARTASILKCRPRRKRHHLDHLRHACACKPPASMATKPPALLINPILATLPTSPFTGFYINSIDSGGKLIKLLRRLDGTGHGARVFTQLRHVELLRPVGW